MPATPSTRLGLVGPLGTETIAQGDDNIRAIITQLEAIAAAYKVGTAAARSGGDATKAGLFYIATDTGVISVATGSAWVDINPSGVYQPLDSDLTAIAALSTSVFGRARLTDASANTARINLGLAIGTDVQAHDADLDAIAALTTTTFGRSLLTQVSAAAAQATLGVVGASFGDGSDGALVFSTAGTVAGATRSGTTYTLTRDLYATDITVNATVIVITGGYRLFATGTLTNNGTIHNAGSSGGAGTTTPGSAGAGGLGGSTGGRYGPGGLGGAGGLTGAGGGGTATTTSQGGTGGTGGTSTTPSAGGAGGAATAATGGIRRNALDIINIALGATTVLTGGAGGGGGGGV